MRACRLEHRCSSTHCHACVVCQGGNAPYIVFDDADVEAAAKGIVASAFRNAGQTCICANRVFVQARATEQLSSYDWPNAGLCSDTTAGS